MLWWWYKMIIYVRSDKVQNVKGYDKNLLGEEVSRPRSLSNYLAKYSSLLVWCQPANNNIRVNRIWIRNFRRVYWGNETTRKAGEHYENCLQDNDLIWQILNKLIKFYLSYNIIIEWAILLYVHILYNRSVISLNSMTFCRGLSSNFWFSDMFLGY